MICNHHNDKISILFAECNTLANIIKIAVKKLEDSALKKNTINNRYSKIVKH